MYKEHVKTRMSQIFVSVPVSLYSIPYSIPSVLHQTLFLQLGTSDKGNLVEIVCVLYCVLE